MSNHFHFVTEGELSKVYNYWNLFSGLLDTYFNPLLRKDGTPGDKLPIGDVDAMFPLSMGKRAT